MPVFRRSRRSPREDTPDDAEPPLMDPMTDSVPSDTPPEAAQPTSDVSYEGTPLTRPEYISAIVHLYRGEVYRATVQRTRLDMTTNWAVLTTAGLLAFSFREDSNPHWALLVGMLLITLYLVYEARRYQMFDVWRSRVRKIEENFYGPILRRNPVSPHREWGERVARDLFLPSYKTTFIVALRARLLRNYWGIYAVLTLSWVLKVVIYPNEAHSFVQLKENLRFGMISWWMPLLYLTVFLTALVAIAIFVPSTPPADNPNEEFWVEAGSEGDDKPIDV
jgi:uncharacterized membrane protein